MKALSVWQPWASLIAMGLKRYETRSWWTSYRGPLVICAAKRNYDVNEAATLFYKADPDRHVSEILWLPKGMALCVVELVSCSRTDGLPVAVPERLLGDFSRFRFAWELKNLKPFVEPFSVRGRQRLFDVDDELVERALKAA